MEGSPMEKRIYITPPSLLRWQPRDRRNDVVFLDLEPDFLNDNTIRLDLDIVFRPIPVKHGVFEKADFYIGSTAVSVTFEATGGKVKNYTHGTPFNVDYEKTIKRSRKTVVKLSPELEIGSEASVSVGEVTFDKDNDSTFTAKFSGSELVLTDTNLGYGVEWDFVPPTGQVIRDYLVGNLHLYVEALWNENAKAGKIILRPSNIRFFDSDRRVIGSKLYKAWLMLFILFKRKEGSAVNSDPTVINFKEVR
jgi:hypothetical protein